MIQAEVERLNAAARLRDVTPEQKAAKDRSAWQAWLKRYGARLQQEAQAGASPEERVQTMNTTNPRWALLPFFHVLWTHHCLCDSHELLSVSGV